MVDLGFRVDEGLKMLLYRKCSKYNLGWSERRVGGCVCAGEHAGAGAGERVPAADAGEGDGVDRVVPAGPHPLALGRTRPHGYAGAGGAPGHRPQYCLLPGRRRAPPGRHLPRPQVGHYSPCAHILSVRTSSQNGEPNLLEV